MNATYAHTNIVARDWRCLADFYCVVFGCIPVPPERNHHGEWLHELTGLEGARIAGIHLRLPGFGSGGPTLEIFSYEEMADRGLPAVNGSGLGHLAFMVDDVGKALAEVEAQGGRAMGKICRREIPGAGAIELVYTRDPEGNIVELQHWS